MNPAPTLSEEAIRPPSLMQEKSAAVDADRAFLLQRRTEWVEVDCPACGSPRRRPFAEKHGFTYRACLECATVYTSPRPSLALSHDFYRHSQNYAHWNRHIFPATADARRTRIFAPRAARLATYCQHLRDRDSVLLEVGAAFGLFCSEVAKLGLFHRILALEPTPDLAATCRTLGLEVLEMPIEDLPPSPLADVIAAFEVIEHLFSPARFVEHCRALLKEEGLLILSCPNVEGFDLLSLGAVSATFDHEHVNYFNPRSLPRLLERFGFSILDVATPGELDAGIVRRRVLAGDLSLDDQPLLRRILVEDWERLGPPFQRFLADHRLSSHLWVVARKTRLAPAAPPAPLPDVDAISVPLP